jgi:hypothetical protein
MSGTEGWEQEAAPAWAQTDRAATLEAALFSFWREPDRLLRASGI